MLLKFLVGFELMRTYIAGVLWSVGFFEVISNIPLVKQWIESNLGLT